MSSQNGEDGILDCLIEVLGLDSPDSTYPRAFIEFGVQDYTESNTCFLLQKRNFIGLVIDGSVANIQCIRGQDIFCFYDLEAWCTFITKENINGP
ncbi:hypothetical protein HHE02_05720 [Helicobacter heilmannii]|uniref:Uncharacterized protein n=1 Tax=Helicobacter heilmannii TaxID=35817 RepID=A0A0K2XGP8_HELHE|nr:hypothetical protein [Helicobacter heilmannii]CCM12078.1 hypothetical protein BN341_5670 [Helicobacter heilmannii ASB1.4]CRF45668.1 hypothetical protein HHE014_06390 [Helicobacter heilmannii]CRF47284.1 hypothetical protein HHE02_05720 [Helicobacter heilmannii]CRF48762.1 hypothetical protein HHE03_03360 [Helicobacter heilmannii]CRF51649.1 hypothetical protein HHE06_15370 [Helicobacter heilmannii]